MTNQKTKTGLLFGSFDKLHPGHIHLLRQAQKHAERLVISLATDQTIKKLKGRAPQLSFAQRKADLLARPEVADVITGDTELGTYQSMVTSAPDMILLGYDQTDLAVDLQRWMETTGTSIPIITLHPYKPEQYKSSLLRTV